MLAFAVTGPAPKKAPGQIRVSETFTPPGVRRRAEERHAAARRKKGVEERTCRYADRTTLLAEIVDGTDILHRREPKVHALAWS